MLYTPKPYALGPMSYALLFRPPYNQSYGYDEEAAS